MIILLCSIILCSILYLIIVGTTLQINVPAGITALCSIFIIIITSLALGKTLKTKETIAIEQIQIYSDPEELSIKDSVLILIKDLNIQHSDIVFQQAIIESSNFSSKVFKENNNIFGMRVPNRRPNTVVGSKHGYAVYNSWQESVIDYALFQLYSAKNLNRDQYLNFLNKNYSTTENYSEKLWKN